MELLTDSLDILSYKYHALLRGNLDQIMGRLYQLIQEKSEDSKLQVKIVLIFSNLLGLIEPHLS